MHKHLLVRFARGLIPQELLAVAAESYTAGWTGEVMRWGRQLDIQLLDPSENPDDVARTVRYLVKMPS